MGSKVVSYGTRSTLRLQFITLEKPFNLMSKRLNPLATYALHFVKWMQEKAIQTNIKYIKMYIKSSLRKYCSTVKFEFLQC